VFRGHPRAPEHPGKSATFFVNGLRIGRGYTLPELLAGIGEASAA
jgi:hypothetical protein